MDIEDIKRVVGEAGQLARLYAGKVSQGIKADSTVVTEADAALEGFLKLALTGLDPACGYLGEETAETRPPAAGDDRFWVVDALDGSRAFSTGIPLWTPAVCLMAGHRPVAGAAINPMTGELFSATVDGPAECNGHTLRVDADAVFKPNSFVFGPTNHHRTFHIDFPGRVYCLGAPIYQLCLVAKGAAKGMFFDACVNLWDLALPALMLERAGGVLVYASGRPVDLAELMDRREVPEPIFAGNEEVVAVLRQRIRPR